MTFTLTSSAFTEGAAIPDRHTCSGAEVSPPLRWTDAPAGTRAFALVVDDPDAPRGTFTHWLVWNLPADADSLPETGRGGGQLPGGAPEGTNSGGDRGWMGPCPPPGGPHRYHFTLHALDAELQLPAGADRAAVLAAVERHSLGQARLMGRYERR
jgi:Raf kinase inhibitor-like YbhB/YbcL family protein